MALFEYFPTTTSGICRSAIALESGGQIGEIVDMCEPIRDAAERGEDAGTGAFLEQWVKMADKLARACGRGRGARAGCSPPASKLQARRALLP